jgi:hypothetical protein
MTAPTEFLTPEQKQKFFEQCSSEDCQNAVTRLGIARNAFAKICNDIQVWNNLRTVYAALAATAFAGALAAAVAAAGATATVIGIPLAAVLWVSAAVFALVGLMLSALAANAAVQYGYAQGRLTNAQDEFSAALADALTKCGRYCNIGDQNMPKC